MLNTTPLPRIMVAPNGARRTQAHHPNIPLTEDAIVEAVIECQSAGADGAHLHIRGDNGEHQIDAGNYHSLLTRLKKETPTLYLQVTSEAAGTYSADQQQHMMRTLKPRYVSVALREMVRAQDDWQKAVEFYNWASDNDVQIQHILYSPAELQTFLTSIDQGKIPGRHHLLQFVLGNYDGTQISDPNQVSSFTKLLEAAPTSLTFDWMLCAFGKEETTCLIEAIKQGGKARIGFENSLWNSDGSLATNNAERVAELVANI